MAHTVSFHGAFLFMLISAQCGIAEYVFPGHGESIGTSVSKNCSNCLVEEDLVSVMQAYLSVRLRSPAQIASGVSGLHETSQEGEHLVPPLANATATAANATLPQFHIRQSELHHTSQVGEHPVSPLANATDTAAKDSLQELRIRQSKDAPTAPMHGPLGLFQIAVNVVGTSVSGHEVRQLASDNISNLYRGHKLMIFNAVVLPIFLASWVKEVELKDSPRQNIKVTPTSVIKFLSYILLTMGTYWVLHNIVLDIFGNTVLGMGHISLMLLRIDLLVYYILHVVPFALLAFVPWPHWSDSSTSLKQAWCNDPAFLSEIAVVVPCHKSADEIEASVHSYLKHFKPEQIVLVDNANSEEPPDDLRLVVQKHFPCVNYMYVPKGLKSQALHVGVNAMPGYKYVLLVDDDTQLPEDMVFDEGYFKDDKVAGIGYSRNVIQHNLLTRVCNFQLKHNAGQMRGGVMYALAGTNYLLVGTTALYRRDYWLHIMEDHPCTPYGEDLFAGSLALQKGYRLAFDLRSCTNTFSPPVLSNAFSSFSREQGYGAASLWKQRAMRWNCTGTRNMPFYFKNIWSHSANGLAQNIWYRYFQFRPIYEKFLAVLQPILMLVGVYFGGWQMLMYYLCIVFVQVVQNCAHNAGINYIMWAGEPQHQASFFTICVASVVDIFLHITLVVGGYKCLTFDIWHPDYRWKVGIWKTALPTHCSGMCAQSLDKGKPASEAQESMNDTESVQSDLTASGATSELSAAGVAKSTSENSQDTGDLLAASEVE